MISGSYKDHPEEEKTLNEPSLQVVAAPANPAFATKPARAAGKGRKESKRAEQQTIKVQEATEIEVVRETVPEPVKVTKPMIKSEPEAAADTAPTPASAPAVVPDVPATALPREAKPVAEPVPAVNTEVMIETLPKPVKEPEPMIAAEPKPIAEPEPAPVIEQSTPVVEPEPASKPVSNPAIEPVAPSAEPPLKAELEPAPEPVAIPAAVALAGLRRLLKPQPSEEEKAAARKAARQKKLDEGSEESPFSVIVGQVYDGPMDLLLDLIRKQDIDIYDIPIATITSQFLAYVNQLRASDVDVAGDFIYTASLLIHIKSKMLLPHSDTGPEQASEDPRRELVERLLEHERFKNAAQMLLEKQMLEAASWSNPGAREFKDDEAAEPEIAADTVDLVRIFREILERARNRPVIDVEEDSVTVGQMIQFLARRLTLEDKPVALRRLLSHTHSERALIAMFLALLEMVRLQAILLRQDRQFSEIFIKKSTSFETVMNEGLGNARDDWR